MTSITEPATDPETEKNDGNKLRSSFFKTTAQLFTLLHVSKITYFIPFALALVRSAVLLVIPLFYKTLIDNIGVYQGFDEMLSVLLMLVSFTFISYILNIFTQRAFQRLGIFTISDLRISLFAHLQKMSLNYYHKQKTGKIMAYMTNDSESVNGLLSSSLINLVLQFIVLVGSFAFMIVLSWQMCLILIILMPLLFYISSIFARRANSKMTALHNQVSEVSGEIQEAMDGLRTIRNLRTADFIKTKFYRSIDKELEAREQVQNLWSIIIPFNQSFTYISIGITIVVGGYLSLNSLITLGTLFAFILYFQEFAGPLQQIASFFTDIQSAMAGGQRILKVLQEEPDIVDAANASPLHNLSTIRFDDVTFSYGEEAVLKNINIEIHEKERIAIVGPTGAGKTTLASLIPRFYDVKSGRILINGNDIKTYTLDSLRSQIGMVLQDTYLFNDTVKENIRFGRRNATDLEIQEIAKKIGIHDFILSLSDGYETKLGERGAILSVGQQQLLAIARTLLANPSVLILDEATSSVDTFSEVLIQKALNELLKARTSIIIAHRFSTIVNANKIFVIEGGKIMQQGTHATLVREPGLYQRYYQMQFAEQR